MSFAKKFREARTAAGLTQQQVADALGLDRTAIAQYERGASKPQFENIPKICKLFNINPEALF